MAETLEAVAELRSFWLQSTTTPSSGIHSAQVHRCTRSTRLTLACSVGHPVCAYAMSRAGNEARVK